MGVDLPKVVVQYSGVSKECQESSSLIIERLATAFDPAREMFTAFFEVCSGRRRDCDALCKGRRRSLLGWA